MNTDMYIEELGALYKKKNGLSKSEKGLRFASLWLAIVEAFYMSKYHYNLGYKRKSGDPPRKHRPGIVIGKEGKTYEIIFLSTSYGSQPYVTLKYCYKEQCGVNFEWKSTAKVFCSIPTAPKESPRKVFLVQEDDFPNLMIYCGWCREKYVRNLKKQIKKKGTILVF